MVTRIVLALAGLLASFITVSPTNAQEKLRLAWAGFSPTNSPIWVIEDRKLLQKVGVDPEKDVKIIPAGGNPERFAALSKGLVQFTIMPEPFLTQAEKLGFRNLYNVTDLKIPFWWNGILSREAIIKTRRPLLLKLTRAMVEAIHIIKTEKEYAKGLFKKNLGVADPEGLERAYQDYSNVFPEIPYPHPDGVKTMLDDLAPRNPKAAAADPKAFVDLSLVKEVEASGLIKQLYKK